jgi:hypothetical protein
MPSASTPANFDSDFFASIRVDFREPSVRKMCVVAMRYPPDRCVWFYRNPFQLLKIAPPNAH